MLPTSHSSFPDKSKVISDPFSAREALTAYRCSYVSLQPVKEISRRDLVALMPSENYLMNLGDKGIRSNLRLFIQLFSWRAVETMRMKSLNLRV
jgi:hypothetical protein